MKIQNTLMADILQYVRDNPGATGSQVHFRFQLVGTRASISGTLNRLQRMGMIKNQDCTGSRWSVWYPIEFEQADPQFLTVASMLLQELKRVPKSEREALLARRLQNLVRKEER